MQLQGTPPIGGADFIRRCPPAHFQDEVEVLCHSIQLALPKFRCKPTLSTPQPASGESYSRNPRQVFSNTLVRSICCNRSDAQSALEATGSPSVLALFGHSVSQLGRPVLVSSI